MKNLKAGMLNRKASDSKSKPDEVLDALELNPGQAIADIGSGGGYFCLRLAGAVGKEGRVYAIDTNQGSLECVKDSAKENGLNNVKTVLVTGKPNLPESVDLVFMRNVTHHMKNRVEYFKNLEDLLKPGGRIAIIEYKKSGFSFHRMFGHYVPKETLIEEMEEAGYRVEKSFDFLPEQSFTIFSKRA